MLKVESSAAPKTTLNKSDLKPGETYEIIDCGNSWYTGSYLYVELDKCILFTNNRDLANTGVRFMKLADFIEQNTFKKVDLKLTPV